MRLKTNLLIKTPFQMLTAEDKIKVKNIDPRYSKHLETSPEKSFFQLKKEIRPYIVTTREINTDMIVILAKTKKEMWRQLHKETRKQVILIQVETEHGLKTLKKP